MQNGDHTELSGEDTSPNNSQSQADEEEREDTSYLAAVDDGKGRTVVVMAPGQKELGFRQPAPDCPLSAAGVVSLPGSSGLVMSERYSSALSELAHACRGRCDRVEASGVKAVMLCSECRYPLLGPPFTHQRPPGRMVYFGEPSCEQDLDRYLESVKYLWSFYQRESPVIINTMGWVPMRSVALRVVHCDVAPSHVMYAVNASLVGVLRGVDVARGLYFIVTPLSVERLRQVNCLLVGSVALPQDLFRSQVRGP
ncbi:Polynucleotide 5'-hydroxyl-kinase NOL9 [Acipenser ruthenus]|uniref:Polynucleotide 5'-hydroxyl-kinase NOL9 n=1 Tax=Acipenser ruthenus TaxID=7906 RepID=A0A444V2J3_ACIRT|nr:Polynucleotide 5'-hydroxyl-kinase NOL9 [Acipenser ruthenus]